MAGKYTEAQKRAQETYYKKLKEKGIRRNHGNYENNKQLKYRKNAILLIKYLFKNAPF